MRGTRISPRDRLDRGPAPRLPRNPTFFGAAVALLAAVYLTVLASTVASATEPPATETPAPEASPTPPAAETPPATTPTPFPKPATPRVPATPYPTAIPQRTPTPAAEDTPEDGTSDSYVEYELPPESIGEEAPTPNASPTPTPWVSKVNTYWMQRARAIANQYWLGEFFIRQMRQESGFNDDVITGVRVSSAGAEGIAQIMRKYHPTVDPLDPEAALKYAAQHMQDLMFRYDGNVRKALAAYNAGATAVDRGIALKGDDWLSSMPHETQLYIEKIMLPGEPDTLPRWDTLRQWWVQATEALGARMHLRLLFGTMVSVGMLPTPPQELINPEVAAELPGSSIPGAERLYES